MATSAPVHHESVRGVRTFRVLPDGRLAPITDRPPWTPGVNTATCDRRTLTRRLSPAHQAPAHQAPGTGCVCGFWACGNVPALRQTGVLGTSRVLAVVAAHGQLVPARRGFRAQHAQIEALWLSPRVPATRRAAVARAYPAAALYASKAAMLAEHPPTVLPTYRLPDRPRASRLLWQVTLLTAWTLALTVLWLLTPYPDAVTETHPARTHRQRPGRRRRRPGHHPPHPRRSHAAAGHAPRLWRFSPTVLLPQTTLLLAGQLTLDDATAWLQLGLTTTSTTVTHLLTAAVVITRLYRLDTDER